ncbi:MAG: Nif3-like dinuclear metal center hexameric protein, partial [Clostridia bacterium]
MKIPKLDRELRAIFGKSEDWDNDGIMIDCGNEIKSVLVALDVTIDAIETAKKIGADAIITHHPLIFNKLECINIDESVSKRAIMCIKNNISVCAYHTCLDIYDGGVNDCLCKAIGIKNTVNFLPFARVGELLNKTSYDDFVKSVEKSLNTKAFMLVDSKKAVKKVAVVSGGGKDYIFDAYKTGADTYLTGEVNHSAMIDAAVYKIN